MNLRYMYPMQLNWQIAKVQRFVLTAGLVSLNLALATYLESLKLSGIHPLEEQKRKVVPL